MSEFVVLCEKRHRGWPWPEESYGLTPMFGEDGWCHACGVPKHAQTGSLMLKRAGLTVSGAWMSYGRYDTFCMEASVAEEVRSRFDVDLRPVGWPQASPGDAFQLVVPTVAEAWFDPAELSVKAIEWHGWDGKTCAVCGVWRWSPIGIALPLRITPPLGEVDVAASPEWFGDGWSAFRQVLVRRELAELLVAASPRDFRVEEVEFA